MSCSNHCNKYGHFLGPLRFGLSGFGGLSLTTRAAKVRRLRVYSIDMAISICSVAGSDLAEMTRKASTFGFARRWSDDRAVGFGNAAGFG